MKRLKRWFMALLLCLPLAQSANVHADQVIYQPGTVPGTDVWLSSYYDYGSNYGVDDDKLQAGGWGDEYRFLIQFDLSNLPSNATLAELWMVPFSRGDSSTLVEMYVDRVTGSWNEDTGWYNQPAATNLGWVLAPVLGYWYGINITGTYNNWKNGVYSNYGFMFRPLGNNNQFSQFRSSDYSYALNRPKLVVTYNGANLRFPLQYNSWTPYTATIASVFDHQMIIPYDFSEPAIVRAYTGEVGDYQGYPSDPTCVNQQSGQPFVINGHYAGATSCGGAYYLSYNSHPGFDYPVPLETPVYASASGTIDGNENGSFDCPSRRFCAGYGRIGVRHSSGYSTWYLHLSKQVGGLQKGSNVSKGQLIGYSGQTSPVPVALHLHFEVRKNNGTFYGLPVDPYGWKGEWNTDPYRVDGKDNVCLWETCQ